jgi:hypothetical protein
MTKLFSNLEVDCFVLKPAQMYTFVTIVRSKIIQK